MSIALIKSNLHKMIDKIQNEDLLQLFYQTLTYRTRKDSKIWNSLSEEEKKKVLLSYDEQNKDEKNLVRWEDVKAKYEKWLSK